MSTYVHISTSSGLEIVIFGRNRGYGTLRAQCCARFERWLNGSLTVGLGEVFFASRIERAREILFRRQSVEGMNATINSDGY